LIVGRLARGSPLCIKPRLFFVHLVVIADDAPEQEWKQLIPPEAARFHLRYDALGELKRVLAARGPQRFRAVHGESIAGAAVSPGGPGRSPRSAPGCCARAGA